MTKDIEEIKRLKHVNLDSVIITEWDIRKIAFVSGELLSWSKDPSTKVGAAIFNEKYPICSSYNGFPPGVQDLSERLNNREIKYKLTQHAEANCISTAARLGIKTHGMTMAVSTYPCSTCAGIIISAGISEIIYLEPTDDFISRWQEEINYAKLQFSEAGVIMKGIHPSKLKRENA